MCNRSSARMYIVIIAFVVVAGVQSNESGDPPGHLQPLGAHRDPIKVEEREDVPNPVEFFNDYITPGKPLVLRGAAKLLPNFKTWRDDEYLSKKYGNWFLTVEKGKYEGSIYGGTTYMSLKRYVKNYQSKEYYVIQGIAVNHPMRDEIGLLKAMACGGYDENIMRILLLFSSGSTQSALHWDGVDNMHCVLDGTKEWIMFHRETIPRLPKLKNATAYAELDCRSVDMYKYPVVQELPWYHAFLEAGDCFYVPHSWPHHVRSSNRRSMALAVWSNPMVKLNVSNCPENMENLPNSVPIGRKNVTRSSQFKGFLLSYFEDRAKPLSHERYLMGTGDNQGKAEEMFKKLDLNNDGYLSLSEIDNVTEEDLTDVDYEVFDNEDEYLELKDFLNTKDEL